MPEPEEVRVDVEGQTLTISNLSKVLYPATGTTKGEVLHYYAQVGPTLIPHLRGRAVTRIRWPHGTEADSFFEKNLPAGAPSWLPRVTLDAPGSRTASEVTYPLVNSLADLTYLANLASLELHVHQWRVDADGRPLRPDRMVIDLDPGAPAGLQECARAALLVREVLAEEDQGAVPVTSGSKGLHLYVPLPGALDAGEVRDRAKRIAEDLQREHPTLLVSQMTKARRPGKVFLDWSQNTAAKTTISPYSLRGRRRPLVAAPRTWEEIEAGAEDEWALGQVAFDELLDRLAEHGDLAESLLPAWGQRG